MKYEYLSNTPLKEAVDDFLAELHAAGFTHKTESVSTAASLGRITAKAVYAKLSSPHYNSCAMDGIAVRAADTYGASATTPVTLGGEKYIAVDTGDPLPEGCDSVVMIEDVLYDGSKAKIIAPVTPWQNVRQIGEDICSGDMLLTSFTKITPYSLGALIAAGVTEIEAVKKPLCGIIPTGDEIVMPCGDPKTGDIIEFNSSIFSAMLAEWGCESKVYPIVKDKKELIAAALDKSLDECDITLINAGSSAGRDDYTASVIAQSGKVIHHGIAIKPGKPAVLGVCRGKAVIGVPGYPVSGIIVLLETVKPVIEQLLKTKIPAGEYEQATLAKHVNSSLKYEEYIRVQLGRVNGRLTAVPLNKGAGVVTSFVKADGLLSIPQNSEGLENGAKAAVQLLKPAERINSTIVVTGSHDPLIDEIADIMRVAGSAYYLSSSHVGSTGGLIAVKRGEAHTGGTHLLDEQTGLYNTPYLQKHFTENEAVLIHCVNRQQGLMLQNGNPKNICSLKDIAADNVSYVNRQKGSGTRVLLDYLLQKDNIDKANIYGYEREEFTHTAVAALVAAGSADCGMGIYSAAKIYSLDFIPLCNEQYDFVMLKENIELPMIKEFIAILKSREFARRISAMGGYELNRPGEIEYIG